MIFDYNKHIIVDRRHEFVNIEKYEVIGLEQRKD